MPVKDLKYDVLMDDVVIASDLGTTTFVKTGLNNGSIHKFIVKAKFNLVESDYRSFTVESEPAYLSAFKKPEPPTALSVSNLADTSLTLSWTAGSLNGTYHMKYRIYDSDVLITFFSLSFHLYPTV